MEEAKDSVSLAYICLLTKKQTSQTRFKLPANLIIRGEEIWKLHFGR